MLASALYGCGSRPPPDAPTAPIEVPSTPPPQLPTEPNECREHISVPDDCWPEHEANVLLARLGVSALAATGSIAPELYKPSSNGETLELAKAAAMVNREFEGQFKSALDAVQKNALASSYLRSGRAAALAQCGKGGCKTRTYKVSLEVVPVPSEGTSEYHFVIQDELPPTLAEWEDVFFRQYSYISPHCAIFGRSILVPDPMAPEERGGMNTTDTKGYASSRGDHERTGMAHEDASYNASEPDCCPKGGGPNPPLGVINKKKLCRSTCPD